MHGDYGHKLRGIVCCEITIKSWLSRALLSVCPGGDHAANVALVDELPQRSGAYPKRRCQNFRDLIAGVQIAAGTLAIKSLYGIIGAQHQR